MDTLVRIKRAVVAGHYGFSDKAETEMDRDNVTETDVAESILSAAAIHKTLRSTSPSRKHAREKLYIIVSTNLSGTLIYTKGKLESKAGVDTYYFLVSSKKAL